MGISKVYVALLTTSLFCSTTATAIDLTTKSVLPFESAAAGPFNCTNGVEYKPLARFDAATYTDAAMVNNQLTFQELPWPNTTAEINSKLPNIATEIGRSVFTAGGGIAGFFKADASFQTIVIDFIKYRSEIIKGPDKKTMMFARVGVGMRIFVKLENANAGFNGSLMSLAASLSVAKSKGSISAELIGIDSPDVTQAMPFTSDLTEASIQRIIEAMAVVKSRLSDDKTKLRPQLLAEIACKETV